jgi:phosphonopyruvate decarboxylase
MITLEELKNQGYSFFTGVPDSLLSPLIKEIEKSSEIHIIAPNEGLALSLAVGAELAGKKSCVYLQNSGLGNLINPLTSLCIPFDIHPLLIIGHRHTLEQHKVMGDTDRKILELLGYKNFIIVEGSNNES